MGAGRAVVPESLVVEPAPVEPGAEVLEDSSAPIHSTRRGLPIGKSLPGAIAGTLLVAGLAFGAALGPIALTGAGAGGDATGNPNDGAWGGHEPTTAPGGGDQPGATQGSGDGAGATNAPGSGDAGEPSANPEPTTNPEPTRTPEPTRNPEPTAHPSEHPDATPPPDGPFSMWTGAYQGHPVIEWAACTGGDFDVYKVVRSLDETVMWPLGDNDTLIATIPNGANRRAVDTELPQGVKAWYRVFCIRLTDGGDVIVNVSVVKSTIITEPTAPPTAPPPPDPISLGSSWLINFEGRLNLSWSTCNVDGFAFYKVVKSTTNDNPSYVPLTDGSVVVATFTDKLAAKYVEWAPDAGQTAWYRVQCIGYQGDHQVLLGQTGVVTVTAP